MTLRAGIVGLPNVGKSTLFTALTTVQVDRASYPFTTIQPNLGVLAVPDERLDILAAHFPDRSAFAATVEIVDVAGLVRGASQGEGLGNRFLAEIRNVDALIHVVRCFEEPEVASVTGRVDPIGDIETVELELTLADLEVVGRKLERSARAVKTGDRRAVSEHEAATRIARVLEEGHPLRDDTWGEAERRIIKELQLLTAKPVLYVCNTGEDLEASHYARAVRQWAASRRVIVVCAQLEAEIAELEPDERAEFLEAAGQARSGAENLAVAAYELLGLISFFTTPTEVRAWELPRGSTALQAAARIHSDFSQRFIRCEVYRVPDLTELGSEAALRASGRMRTEGRDYLVEDGDVILFKIGT